MKLKVKIGIPVVGALLAALLFFVFSRNSDPSSTVQKLNSAAGNFDFVVKGDLDLPPESQIGTSPESVIQHAEEGLVLSACDENGISVALFKSEENAQEIVRLQDSNLGVPISDSFTSGRFERKYPGGVTEWYDNAEVGIQHGFTLHSSDTVPRKDGFPHIEISLDTEFSASLDRNDRVGDHIVFESDSTSQRLFYHSLVVFDATGKRLPSLLRLGRSNTEARTIEIAFCDADAVYPVTVDPFFSTTLSSPFVGDESSAPSHFTTSGETLFFTAEDSNSGRELWKIESPSDAPLFVADINPGLSSSNPDQVTAFNGGIVFTADDGTHGEELWVSNGTSGGTVLLADIANGIETSNPRIEATTGSLLFFVAENSTYGEELWVTDGTPANTRMVKDIYPGTNSSQPSNIIEWNDEIYFGAWSPDSGRELWKSDGTELGTVLVKDINPGGSSSPSQITPTPGTLYFVGNDGAHGSELWKSDGTNGGTVLVEDIRPGSFGPSISIHGYSGGKLFFSADKGQGFQLWTSRGTAATTSPIEDPDLIASFILYPTSHWGQLYFAARSVGAGFSTFRIWRSSGTVAGTRELANSPVSTDGPFLSAGDQLLFGGYTEDTGSEIWVASRFSSSVTLAKDIFAGTGGSRRFVEDWPENPHYHFERIDNQVVFAARSATGNFEPWISDGTESGTNILAEIAPGARGSFPRDFHEFEGSLFFSAETDHSGAELWSVDLSGLNSPKLFDLNSFSSTESLAVGDKTYFVANSESTGNELWITDGTPENTSLISDIWPGPGSSSPANLVSFDGEVFFTASHPASGRGVWKTDGTSGNTTLVAAVVQDETGSHPSNLTVSGGSLFFTSAFFGSTKPSKLWRVVSGTRNVELVKTFTSGGGPTVSGLGRLLEFEGLLYLQDGRELWKSDGTESGTTPLALFPVYSDDRVSNLTRVDNLVYFTKYQSPGSIRELWKTDGTPEGSVLVKTYSTQISDFTALGQRLLFSSNEGEYLNSSDGTGGGTLRIKAPDGHSEFWPSDLTVLGSEAFFIGFHPDSGRELWKTDGTISGTVMVQDTNPGPGDGVLPHSLRAVGGILYFAAGDGKSGIEMWRYQETLSSAALVSVDISGPQGRSPLVISSDSNEIIYLASDGQNTPPQLYRAEFLSPSEAYEKTIQVAGLSGDDALPGAAPFFDRITNLEKYAFNMDLTGPDVHSLTDSGSSGLPTLELRSTPDSHLRYSFVRSRNRGINYTLMCSETLQPDSWTTVTETPIVERLEGQWERVTMELPIIDFAGKFFRIAISLEE